MIIILEFDKPPYCKAFKFKGTAGKGTVRRYGWFCFGISIVTKHDYFSYHEWVMKEAQLYRE